MNQKEIIETFERMGIILKGHFVYASGRHGPVYVGKDLLYPDTQLTSKLCFFMAKKFYGEDVDAVVAPEKGGIILSQWIAYHLSIFSSKQVFSFYAEKTPDGGFSLNRGNAKKRIPCKRILLAEDVLTTGGSIRKVANEVRRQNGFIVGLTALWNRGGVTSDEAGHVPKLFSLVNKRYPDWDEKECSLCREKVPVNTDFGKQ